MCFTILILLAVGLLYLSLRGTLGRLSAFLQTLQRDTTPTTQAQGDQAQLAGVSDGEELTAESSQPSELIDDSHYVFELFERLYNEYSEDGLRHKAQIQHNFEDRLKAYVERDEGGFRCTNPGCGRLFSSYKFWCKHVENSHKDLLKDCLKESNLRRDDTTPHPTYFPYQRQMSTPDAFVSQERSTLADYASLQVPYEGKQHPTRGVLQRTWFIPADGIDRQVINADIQRYLGPDATVRPGFGTGEYEVRTSNPFLSD